MTSLMRFFLVLSGTHGPFLRREKRKARALLAQKVLSRPVVQTIEYCRDFKDKVWKIG